MIYNKCGKRYNIPSEEISNLMEKLKISKGEALDVWLSDHDLIKYAVEPEPKPKKSAETASTEKVSSGKTKSTKSRISDEKKAVFDTILCNLDRCPGVLRENVEVVKENKLIFVHIGGKIIKIDIIEQKKK